MTAIQLKYRSAFNPETKLGEAIKGSRNYKHGETRRRNRVWRGPRGQLISGVGKRLARLVFDREIRHALA